MKIAHYQEIPATRFDNDAVRNVDGRVLIGQNDGAENFCMRMFELGPDGQTPRHRHPWEHEIIVFSGQGELLCDGQWQPVKRGHAIFIPGEEEHQLRNRGQEPFVFICLIPSGPPEL